MFAERVADIQAVIAQQDRMAEASEDLNAALMARAFDDEIASAAQVRSFSVPAPTSVPFFLHSYTRASSTLTGA